MRFYLFGEMEELAMINFLGCSAQGIAVADGVTTRALLDIWLNEILTRATCEPFLEAALSARAAHQCSDGGRGGSFDTSSDASAVQRIDG